MNSCHAEASTRGGRSRHRQGHGHDITRSITIALAGNANVGKSVIFNRLTGSNQVTGNWPGKTVEKAEGFVNYQGHHITVVDLPGIYSLSTYSIEEIVSREYIAREKPDVIINVIGAPVLERNLNFTLQLMEMSVPMVVCLNQVDIAAEKGITIDAPKLEKLLGIPVVATVAAKNQGIDELLDKAIETADIMRTPPHQAEYEINIEKYVKELTGLVEKQGINTYFPRWIAVKLLERDEKIRELVANQSDELAKASDVMAQKIEEDSQQPSYTAVASNRYAIAGRITHEVETTNTVKVSFSDRLDHWATHKIWGYVISLIVIAGLLLWTFTIGNYLSNLLSSALGFFQSVNPQVTGTFWGIIWNGVFGGLVAGITLVVPYVVPFYLMLALLEDSGILTRVAFMMDSAMHQLGLHGKAIIPIILGFGCNVPAIYSTRIMGTRRERLLAAFAITFSPCAARTIIIFGLVAAFVSIPWALALYAIDILLMFAVGKLALKVVPGELSGLIMEMHSFKAPSISVVSKQTWGRTKSLIYMVFPVYIVSTAIIQGAYSLGILQPVNNALSFLTVGWLQLPAVAGILLIFGAARKELILLMAVALFGTNLASMFTPVQIVVLALVGTIYPCFATVGALTKEFGWKAGWAIIGANMVTALMVGGIAARLLGLVL